VHPNTKNRLGDEKVGEEQKIDPYPKKGGENAD
jgi:hypothetical protein